MLRKVFFVIMGICFVGMLFMTNYVEAAPIKLIVATHAGERSAYYAGLKKALNDIEKSSDGRVVFEYFSGKTLVGSKNSYPSMLKGVCDITISQPAFFPGEMPLSNVVSLFPPLTTAKTPIERGLTEAKFVYPNFEKTEWAKAKVLHCNITGLDVMITKNPVRKPEDLRGKRMFAVGQAAIYMKAYGATPVAMSPMEIYDSVQKGILDGAVIGIGALKSIKLAEVCKYTTIPGFGNVYSLGLMRWESYNKLPDDLKKKFDALKEVAVKEIGGLIDQEERDSIALLKSHGGEVIYLNSQEIAAFTTIAMEENTKWAKGLDAKGLPGSEILKKRYDFLSQYMPGVLPK